MVVSWIVLAGLLIASFVLRRRRASGLRWLCLGLLLGNSGGTMDQFAQDRNWPWHQQILVSEVTLTLSAVGLALVCVAAWTLFRRDTRVSAHAQP